MKWLTTILKGIQIARALKPIVEELGEDLQENRERLAQKAAVGDLDDVVELARQIAGTNRGIK